MAQFERLQVFQSMSRSPNTCLHAMAELGNGMALARWSNAHDARDYLRPVITRCPAIWPAAPAPFAASSQATRAHRTNCASCRPNTSRPGSSMARFNSPTFTSSRNSSPSARWPCSTVNRAACNWQEPGDRLLSAICWLRLLIATRLCENLRLCIATAQSCAHSFLPRGFVDAPGYPPTPPGRLALGIRRR